MSVKNVALIAVAALGLSASAVLATTIDFSWDAPAFTGTETFTTTNAFDVELVSYSGVGSQQTGWALFDAGDTYFTTEGTNCVTATPSFDTCNLIIGTFADGTILLENVPAGTYTIGVFEGNGDPANGSVSFSINQIPLPAAGLMLLGALGLGAVARRKRAA